MRSTGEWGHVTTLWGWWPVGHVPVWGAGQSLQSQSMGKVSCCGHLGADWRKLLPGVASWALVLLGWRFTRLLLWLSLSCEVCLQCLNDSWASEQASHPGCPSCPFADSTRHKTDMKCQAEKRPLVRLWTKQLRNAPVTCEKELWHLPGCYACKYPAWLAAETHAAGKYAKVQFVSLVQSHYRFTFYSEIIIY